MVLDLNVFEEQTLDIHIQDGRVINIPKPSQMMVLKMQKLHKPEEGQHEEAARTLCSLCLDILNSNLNNYTFTMQDIERFSDAMRLTIVNAYIKFILELQSNPT